MLYFRSFTWVYCIAIKCAKETIMYSTSGAPLGCTAFAIKCTAYPIMFIRSLTWVYCTCQQVHWIYHKVYCRDHHVHQEPHLGVLHLPSSVLNMQSFNIRSNTGVYYISHQVYCRGHAVRQEPHLDILHLPSSVLHILSWKSGASLSILYLPHRCTTYAIMYIRSLTWLYCIKCAVETIMYNTSGAPLGCTATAIKCTAYPVMFIRSLAWVYCISQQVHWIAVLYLFGYQ